MRARRIRNIWSRVFEFETISFVIASRLSNSFRVRTTVRGRMQWEII